MSTNPPPTIFDALARQLKRHWLHVLGDEQNGVLTFPPNEIEEAANKLFSNLSIGGFATLVVSGRRSWNPRSYYFEEVRRAARRGCKIQRVFLLPHRQYLGEEALQEHWRLDTDAGIDAKMLYVGNILPTMAGTPSLGLDFGIWDNQLVCSIVTNTETEDKGPSEWRVSKRPEDLQLASRVQKELLDNAERLEYPSPIPTTLDLEEPMVQTAPLMDMLSRAVCNGSYVDEEDCSWYHGVWQYLRIFDLVSTPTWHPDFYIPKLQSLAKECSNARVLVSGTADYSTLAHILWAFNSVKKPCDVTVVDLCQTPLILCQWYARRAKHPVVTPPPVDILKFESEPFDAIVTDAFLTRFRQQGRIDIIKRWFQLLRREGRVITTARIKNEYASEEKVKATPEQIEQFKSKVLERALRWKDFLEISPERIVIKAQSYAENMVSYPFPSTEVMEQEFEENGFSVSYKLQPVEGEMVPTTYAEIVATKNVSPE